MPWLVATVIEGTARACCGLIGIQRAGAHFDQDTSCLHEINLTSCEVKIPRKTGKLGVGAGKLDGPNYWRHSRHVVNLACVSP